MAGEWRPNGDVPSEPPSGSPPPRARRQRYAGTHPRRFAERYKEHDPDRFPDMQAHVRLQGRTPAGTHVPILLPELLECLSPQPGDVVCDATLGYGGHACAFLERIRPTGRLIALDFDAQEARRTAQRLGGVYMGECKAPFCLCPPDWSLAVFHISFAGIAKVLGHLGIDGCDVLYADLGISSMQIDDPQRGFSYKLDGPLDMRMDERLKRTAADLVNTLPEVDLAAALRDLADEPCHAQIAQRIVHRRRTRPLARTPELVELVREATRGTSSDLHPAARTFQALRMLVNDELAALRELLRIAPFCLRPGGRIGILSFHSGEDRLVKRAFREGLRDGRYAAIADTVITPSTQERHSNPRSASAKLRWACRN